MKKKQLLNIFLVFLLSFILMLLLAPLRARNFEEITGLQIEGGFPLSSLVGFILFLYLTVFSLNKLNTQNKNGVVFALIAGLWIIQLPIRIVDFYSTLASLPDSLIQTLGIICGFLYWRLRSSLGLITLFLGSLITVFMFFQGWDYWNHYLNFNNFTGKVSAYKLQQTFEGINEKNVRINNQTLENKIVLLDFWHTRCGVCFQKFPQLQAFYDKYKNDDSIAVFAVDKPIQEDKQKSAFKVIEEEGYNFPVLLPNDEDLPEKFGVKYYPTTFVINRQGNVVYKGSIEGAILTAEELKRNNQ
jgi:thiol-disulfide isomerase/thioredoxin